MSRQHLPRSATQIIGRRERGGAVPSASLPGVNNDLEGLHTDAAALRGQPLEVGLVFATLSPRKIHGAGCPREYRFAARKAILHSDRVATGGTPRPRGAAPPRARPS